MSKPLTPEEIALLLRVRAGALTDADQADPRLEALQARGLVRRYSTPAGPGYALSEAAERALGKQPAAGEDVHQVTVGETGGGKDR